MTEEPREKSGIGEDTSQGGEGGGPIEGQGGEGDANQESTPPITEQGKPGQTQHDAPDDDVGGQRGGEDGTDEG